MEVKLVSPSVLFNYIENMLVDIRSNEKLRQLKAVEPHSLNISTRLLYVYSRGSFIYISVIVLCFPRIYTPVPPVSQISGILNPN